MVLELISFSSQRWFQVGRSRRSGSPVFDSDSWSPGRLGSGAIGACMIEVLLGLLGRPKNVGQMGWYL